MAKTVAIIQARAGSARLPGKVLRPLLGKPMLARMLERVRQAKKVDAIVVATTIKPQDDAVVRLAQEYGVGVFRGDENDVLDRMYKAAKEAQADVVVRLTGDCPLNGGEVIDETVEHYRTESVEYSFAPVNYPEGFDTEVFSFSALERAWKEAKDPYEREHVTPYIRNHPELFSIASPWRKGEGDYSAVHLSVDTEADFNRVEEIYKTLGEDGLFSKDAVLQLLNL